MTICNVDLPASHKGQHEPLVSYQRYHARHSEAARALRQREMRLSSSRLWVFVLGVVIFLLSLDTGWYSPWWTVPPATTFIVLVFAHDRTIRSRRHAERAERFYSAGLARLEDRWIGLGSQGERFADPHHPFAVDLDLFGRGSLFELLCQARTRAGEDALARWLLSGACPATIVARQQAIAELKPRLEFREDMALLGEDVQAALDPASLAAWATGEPILPWPWLRWLAAGLVGATGITAFTAASGHTAVPLLVALLAEVSFALILRPRVSRVLQSAQHPDRDLALFGTLLARIEKEEFTSELMRGLIAGLNGKGEPPSHRIARLHRLVHLLDARKNQLFAPISGFLLWGTQCALAIEAWRTETGAEIARWLGVVAETEALVSLSGYAWEHPADPFPEIEPSGACIQAVGLGHPLLPESRCVRNDVKLGEASRAWIVSGSNMSGKSTLLRTVGTNAVLALAGAPVRAVQMRISPVAIGASIRTLDSLQEGTSRFYAEIKRLRQLMDLADGATPLLFLLDEILHGTNSHDRGIGAEAIVRGLVSRGGIGLVTTHDLALTRVAESMAPLVINVHFEDQLQDGELRFDYRVRPGVVSHSNALELMRSVGLDV
jgi:hypothetical protein